MLLLGRKFGAAVHVTGEINVTVMAVNGNQIRSGIDPPIEAPVGRRGLFCPRDALSGNHGNREEIDHAGGDP